MSCKNVLTDHISQVQGRVADKSKFKSHGTALRCSQRAHDFLQNVRTNVRGDVVPIFNFYLTPLK